MVTLVVEDGTGLITANAFVSLDFVDTYAENKANATWSSTDYEDDDRNSAIIRATAYMSNHYDWSGIRSYGRDSQALYWPRAGMFDKEGYSIDTDEIPVEMQNATSEIAFLELVTPGTMDPSYIVGDSVKREKIGVLETEYTNYRLDAGGQRPDVTIVKDLISSFLQPGGGATSAIVGGTTRI